jgi:hypothetical protein
VVRASHRDLRLAWALLAAAVLALGTGLAHAQGRDGHDGRGGPQERRGPPREVLDSRYHHDRYYPPRGAEYRGVPREHVIVTRERNRYYYSGGVWYAPRGPRFVVVAPPLGVFVPLLPPYYTTVWIGGFPYYYANDAYYAWRPARREYEVVEPPRDVPASTQAPLGDELFIYPKQGQSEEQQARDRYECHSWARSQTGFDPTQVSGGVPAEQSRARRADYFRAMTACLEARGYSVK